MGKKSLVKNIIIGSVPDRGGRANEMRPKASDIGFGRGHGSGNKDSRGSGGNGRDGHASGKGQNHRSSGSSQNHSHHHNHHHHQGKKGVDAMDVDDPAPVHVPSVQEQHSLQVSITNDLAAAASGGKYAAFKIIFFS